MFTYRQILAKAWQITWRNPALWFFGFFVACLGSAGEIEIFLRSVTLGEGQGILKDIFSGFFASGLFTLVGVKGFFAALANQPLSLFISLLLLMISFGLVAFVIWLIMVSQGALINSVISIIKDRKVRWSDNFSFGLSKFWPVLFLNALAKIIFWFLFVILGFFTALKFPGLIFLFTIAFVLFISALIIVSFIIKYAICGAVLKNQQLGDALESALKLFYKNWLLSLEVAFILFLIYLVVDSLLSFFLYLLFIYLLDLFSFFAGAFLLVLAIVLLIFAVIQILLAIFHWTTWVLIFEILTNKKIIMISRVVSGFGQIFSRRKQEIRIKD